MSDAAPAKFRFAFLRPFQLSPASGHSSGRPGSKEQRMQNYEDIAHLLDDVEWELVDGPVPAYGDWPVENREEFAVVAGARMPSIVEVCASGRFNAVILMGGGEPGAAAGREIGRRYGLPVVSFAFSQLHFAAMLGRRFSVIDLAESHSMHYYDLILQHEFGHRCASIRSINAPHARPGHEASHDIRAEKQALRDGRGSHLVDAAVTEALAAIEEDGADVILFSCSGLFWLRPFVEARLAEEGWEVPVLDGLSTSIVTAKAMVELGVDASGLVFPGDRPRRWRRKRTF